MSVPASSSRSPVDDALDRLAELVGALYDRKPIENDYRDALATVRSALEQLREERDAAEEWLGNETRRREAAEVEVQRLREGMENGDRLLSQAGRQLEAAEAEARTNFFNMEAERQGREHFENEANSLRIEVRRLTEGLRETEDVLASVGNWLAGSPEPSAAVIEAIDLRIGKNRALLPANPPQGDAAAGSSPSDGGGA